MVNMHELPHTIQALQVSNSVAPGFGLPPENACPKPDVLLKGKTLDMLKLENMQNMKTHGQSKSTF